MKRILLVISIMCMLSIFAFSQTSSKVNWNNNLDYAGKVSATKNQPLVIFFMDNPAGTLSSSVFNNTLANNLIVDIINKNFVPVLVEGDELLENQYSIQRIPTLLVVDVDGTEMDRLEGVIGIDEAFSMLENAKSNFENKRANALINRPGGAGSANNVIGAGVSGRVYTYTTGTGSFIKGDKDAWIHKTSFYSIDYTQTKEDKRHYYLVSKDKKVHIAVPKTTGTAVWLWEEDRNRWVATEEISRIEQSVGE